MFLSLGSLSSSALMSGLGRCSSDLDEQRRTPISNNPCSRKTQFTPRIAPSALEDPQRPCWERGLPATLAMARAAHQWSRNPVLDFAILQLKWYVRSRGALYTSCNAISSTINSISNAFPGNHSHALKRKGPQSETGINPPLCLLKGCFNMSG